MNHLPKLFQTLELTKKFPLSGLIHNNLHKNHLPSLADHHYLTTLFAWQLARYINQKGGNLNLQRTLELSLVHDLDEIHSTNPNYPTPTPTDKNLSLENLRRKNLDELSNQFAKDQKYFLELQEELISQKSDEAIIIKTSHTIDYLNCMLGSENLTEERLNIFENNLSALTEHTDNLQNGLILKKFIELWFQDYKSKIKNPSSHTTQLE